MGREEIWEVIANLPGPRVQIGPYRIHHGRVGLWLVAVGVVLCLHDWRDRPWTMREGERLS